MKAPQFFEPATISAVASGIGALGSVLGGNKQTFVDDSAVRQQMQARDIAERQKQLTAQRSQQAQQVNLQTQDVSARRRVEALDRIIGVFQQNLRIK